MTVVRNTLEGPSGVPLYGHQVTVTLYADGKPVPGFTGSGSTELVRPTWPITAGATDDNPGQWSVDLVPNSLIDPAGTYYVVAETSGQSWAILVPATGGPYNMRALLTVTPQPGSLPVVPVGLPTGGTTGQVLAKVNGTDFNTGWVAASSGGGAVSSVAGRTGAVVLSSADLSDVASLATAASVTAEATARDTAIAAQHTTDLTVFDAAGSAATAQSSAISTAATDATAKANAAQAAAVQRVNHTGTQSADTLTDGTTNKAFLATERTKLSGVATGATANSTDATLLARANHTGTESADVLTDGTTNKAFLATERTKLAGIATGATANSSDATLLARANHTGTQAMSTISDAGGAATLNVGAAAGTVAAGDDSRITGAAQKASNLSDLASASTARTNLGLGTAAVVNTGTGSTNAILGNDSRLTDTRTPSASSLVDSMVSGSAAINADKIADGATNGVFTLANRTKLSGISTSAAANETSVLPLGGSATGAALGTATTSAHSDHVHPRYTTEPPDFGWLGWSIPSYTATTATGPGSGQLQMARVHIPVAGNVTNVILNIVTGGSTLTSGQSFAALYNSSLALIGVTASQSTAWAGTGLFTMALTGGPFAVAAGDYFVGFWSTGTTPPTFCRAGNTPSINGGKTGNNSFFATSNTGLTTTAPNPATTLTAIPTAYFAAVS